MSDQIAINETIEKYIEGGRQGSSAVMKEAFVDAATIYNSTDGALEGGPIQTLFDMVDTIGPAKNLTYEISAVDINETTATVRIELFDWAGARYTDQMLLLKLAGTWKIMHKVFRTHA